MATKIKTKKPTAPPATDFPVDSDALHRDGAWLWLPVLKEWRDVTYMPEELVRQRYIRFLHDHCGYAVAQMGQERRYQAGTRSPRADIVVWKTVSDKAEARTPGLVVECKADTVEIQERDYYQGESYSRAVGCEFFVATNERHTAIFRLVPGLPGGRVALNALPKVHDWEDAQRIQRIRESQRAFDRKEFQDLLFDCHSILRDVHKMDPGRAFDTISKILFIKMYVERKGLHGTFTTDFIEGRKKYVLKADVPVHEQLFTETKDYYRHDELFTEVDKLDISDATFSRIVKKLERFDLSKTGDDIKGLAFERFLGTTFRGELGQFFTPRPVVDFMVDLLDPKEGELVCDPAAGSGGFLIRAFEHVRGRIAADIQEQKDAERARIEGLGLPQDEEERQIEAAFAQLNHELLPSDTENRPISTRVGRLAWQCIYGTDAEPRAARTAKMNMVMHGDGHGGIHYHDGLVDINGIFDGRFHVVITNPPFGSNVGADQKVGGSDETRVPENADYVRECKKRYGKEWEANHHRLLQAVEEKTPILDLFTIGEGKANRPTELIFVERCLNLLRPGGRLGIVLPDGNLNNPSLAWLRRYVEGRAKLDAVVSLPPETFRSSDATVKASLVFLTRFTDADEAAWEAAWQTASQVITPVHVERRNELHATYAPRILSGDSPSLALKFAKLAKFGIGRVLPGWYLGEPPSYPRGIGSTQQPKPAWEGTPATKDKKAASELKRQIQNELAIVAPKADALLAELKGKYRAVDEEHLAELWDKVRELFDYPIFVAAPKAVGITSTGETGDNVDNDLPALLKEYSRFQLWVAGGAPASEQPNFPMPSAA